MASKYRSTFFDQPRDSSLIKLRVVRKFLAPWSAKVGSSPGVDKVWVVDAFAGPGMYRDEPQTPGSPKLILERATDVRSRNDSYTVGCVFVEKDRGFGAQLDLLCSAYPDVDRRVIHGDFWEHIEEIIAIVRWKPLLLLVDPFGVRGLDYRALAQLARSTPKCDLIVTFVDQAVPRLEAQYPADIERAIGPRVKGESPAEAFARNMTTEGNFLPGGRFEIRQSFDSAKSYELMFFSRSPHAYLLWNDSVTREWENLKRTGVAKRRNASLQAMLPGVEEWEEEADAEAHRREAVDAIVAWAETLHRQFTRVQTMEHFAVHRFGEFHTSTLRSALLLLEIEGRMSCDKSGRRNADSRLWTLVSP